MAESREHVVQDGETIVSIARKYGFRDWETLWDANGELKGKRKNPNLLCKGDRLTIPPFEEKEEACATGTLHTFEMETSTLFLRFRVLKPDFTALASCEYSLQIEGESQPRAGTTDANGQIEIEEPPRGSRSAKLTVQVPPEKDKEEKGTVQGQTSMTWDLRIGGLHPILEEETEDARVRGVQQRLQALGFDCGATTGVLTEQTRRAIRDFREIFGLPKSDRIDDEFQRKLKAVHDDPDTIVPTRKKDKYLSQ